MVHASAKAPAEAVLGLAELDKGKSLTVDAFERRISQLKVVANHYKESEGMSGPTAVGILNVTSAMRRTENQFLLEYGNAATPEQKSDLIVRYNSWLFNSFVGAYSNCWQDMLKRPDEVGNRDLRLAMDAAIKECEQVIASIDSKGIGLADSKGNGYGSRTLLQLVGASRMEEYKQGLRNVIKELKEAKELIGTAYNERAQLLMARASHDEDLLTASLMKDASSKAIDMGIKIRRSQDNWLVNSWNFVTADHTWIIDASVLAISVIPTGVTQAAGAAYFTSRGLSDAAVGATEGDWGKAGMGLLMAATPLAKFPKGLKLTTTGADDAKILAKVAFGEQTVAAATTTGRIAGSGMMLLSTADTVRLIADADVYGWTNQDLEALAANGVFFGIGFVHGTVESKLKQLKSEKSPAPKMRINMLKPEPTARRGIGPERAFDYGTGLAALIYNGKDAAIVLADPNYVLGKHGGKTAEVGSKLVEVDTSERLNKILKQNIDPSKLASAEGSVVFPNIDSGRVTGTDALASIISLWAGGKEVPVGSKLQEGVDYQATVRDAEGKLRPATLRYEQKAPASADGKFPAIMQPIAYVEGELPPTRKLNAVLIPIDLADPRTAWLQPDALRLRVGDSAMAGKKAFAVATVFSGEYAPPANEPRSSAFDPVVGTTGNEFWSKNALMKNEPASMRKSAEVPEAAARTNSGVSKKGMQRQTQAQVAEVPSSQQFAQQKAFVKSEMPLLEKSIKLSSALSGMEPGTPHMIVGGMALRARINAKFKGRIGAGNSATDIDVALLRIPSSLSPVLRGEELAKPIIRFDSMGERRIERPGVGTVFHLLEIFKADMPLFYDVCFFENRMGRLPFQGLDYQKAMRLPFVIKTNDSIYMMDMSVADLGLLGATMLNVDAITETRAKRMAFALASDPANLEETASRYSEVIARGYQKPSEVVRPLRFLMQVTPQSAAAEAKLFVERVAKELNLGKI